MDKDGMRNLLSEEEIQEMTNIIYGDEDYGCIIDTGFDINKFICNSKRENTVFGKTYVLYVPYSVYKSKLKK